MVEQDLQESPPASSGTKAFEILVRRHHRRLLAYAISVLDDENTARDVVQDSFVVAHRRLDEFDTSRDFAAWMRGIVRNRCREVQRQSSRMVLLEGGTLDAIDERDHCRVLGARPAPPQLTDIVALRDVQQPPEVIRVGLAYLRVDSLILPLYMMLFATNSLLQALKRPIWTVWISLYRQAFGVAFFVWIFIGILDFTEIGVWFGVASAVITGWVIAMVITIHVVRVEMDGTQLLSRPAKAAGRH